MKKSVLAIITGLTCGFILTSCDSEKVKAVKHYTIPGEKKELGTQLSECFANNSWTNLPNEDIVFFKGTPKKIYKLHASLKDLRKEIDKNVMATSKRFSNIMGKMNLDSESRDLVSDYLASGSNNVLTTMVQNEYDSIYVNYLDTLPIQINFRVTAMERILIDVGMDIVKKLPICDDDSVFGNDLVGIAEMRIQNLSNSIQQLFQSEDKVRQELDSIIIVRKYVDPQITKWVQLQAESFVKTKSINGFEAIGFTPINNGVVDFSEDENFALNIKILKDISKCSQGNEIKLIPQVEDTKKIVKDGICEIIGNCAVRKTKLFKGHDIQGNASESCISIVQPILAKAIVLDSSKIIMK